MKASWAEENVPEEFGKFTLTYIADDTLAGRVSCKYGEPLSGLAVPSVPQKPGYYGEWEPVGEDTITFDHVLKAVYTPHVTTVESSARRDDVRAVILAEGTFMRIQSCQQKSCQRKGTVRPGGSRLPEIWAVRRSPRKPIPTALSFQRTGKTLR